MRRLALALSLVALLPATLATASSSEVLEHRYVLNASVRPMLLFWIRRDDVGEAKIAWHHAPGERTIELLVGTDPDRAPRQINRWGYLRETVSDTQADVVGLMTASNEESLDEAESEVERRRAAGGTLFKGVHSTIRRDHAMTTTGTIAMDARVSYRHVETVLSAMRESASAPGRVGRPAGTEPGFLFAISALIQRSLEACGSTARSRVGTASVPYLYNKTIYDASLTSCSHMDALRTKVATYHDVIEAHFKVHNRRTGEDTKFRIAYGASGSRTGRPVRIVFRPRWWLEAELLLVDGGGRQERTEAAK